MKLLLSFIQKRLFKRTRGIYNSADTQCLSNYKSGRSPVPSKRVRKWANDDSQPTIYGFLIGKPKWNREAIDKLLPNGKYIGQVLLQKAISTGTSQIKNDGICNRYLLCSTFTGVSMASQPSNIDDVQMLLESAYIGQEMGADFYKRKREMIG